MIVKILAAILAVAILDCASQTVRCSRYVDAQDQTELETGRAEIALSDMKSIVASIRNIQTALNFRADSQVSIIHVIILKRPKDCSDSGRSRSADTSQR